MSPKSTDQPLPAHRTIVVTQTSGIKHVLPYGHFLGAELTASGDGLILMFAVHVVSVEGKGLEKLLIALSNMRLGSLEKTEAEGYRIDDVTVHSRSDDEAIAG